ncbi:MAG: hypothetical protein E7241_07755 [Lachnospiraceae bacterium]|jgi:hypothetical protein|nr:hypothetical protein [Lachnospiraceae bacterium]
MENHETIHKGKMVNNMAGARGFIPILVYLLLFAGAILIFWLDSKAQDGSFAMGYSILFIWISIPVLIIVVSMIIGVKSSWGNFKWLATIFFGLTYMGLPYATFGIANSIAYGNENVPEVKMLFIGIAISLLGMAAGHLILKRKHK